MICADNKTLRRFNYEFVDNPEDSVRLWDEYGALMISYELWNMNFHIIKKL